MKSFTRAPIDAIKTRGEKRSQGKRDVSKFNGLAAVKVNGMV